LDKLNNLKELLNIHNLNNIEYKKITKILKREPNLLELGIYSVMWSEHCSYKSSKKWLRQLPTKSKIVICGPGENAGIIDIGGNDSIVFKIESHNHPSYLEPFQGAATGVGGILRDIFTMGARPIAILDSLRFGDIKQKKQKYLLSGVVSGISNYGNCMGIPTVGGECYFNEDYNKNILVNAMAVGVAKKNKLFFSKAAGINNPVIYVGAKTGKDGIHGATMASAEFDDNSKQKKPTVQVGDPFTEKLVMEACLELMQTNMIVAIQDMGAAGLTCSSFEMAAKGNCGIELNINKIPLREKDMSPYEIMLSESQERMLIILKKGCEKKAKKIFDKWDLDMSVIGKITNSKKMIIKKDNSIIADIPIALTEKNTPEYKRPWVKPKKVKKIKKFVFPKKNKVKEVIFELLKSPNLTSKKWIWEQYDHMVMCDTIKPPSYGAAIVRVHGTKKSLAMTTDCNSNYCKHDPFIGTIHAVSEARRNIISTGAVPLAITNNLNFGNPEDKNIMGQFVMSVKGMINSCKKYSLPVISGNVSLYNETNKIIGPVHSEYGYHILLITEVKVENQDSQTVDLTVITPEALHTRLSAGGSNLILLDLRESWEWDIAHIEGSQLITRENSESILSNLKKDGELILIDWKQDRSPSFVKWLVQQGFSYAKCLEGGIDAWSDKIDPSLARYEIESDDGYRYEDIIDEGSEQNDTHQHDH